MPKRGCWFFESLDKVRCAVQAVEDKKARDIIVLHLKDLTVITDYFIICTGDNLPQIKAIVESVGEGFRREGERPLGIEGLTDGHWVLMDYSDVIIHVFDEDTRAFYDLEKLWLDAPRVKT